MLKHAYTVAIETYNRIGTHSGKYFHFNRVFLPSFFEKQISKLFRPQLAETTILEV